MLLYHSPLASHFYYKSPCYYFLVFKCVQNRYEYYLFPCLLFLLNGHSRLLYRCLFIQLTIPSINSCQIWMKLVSL